ncbi:MAG: hypothetical protein KDD11_05800 [Acidobacteria bacterium]|nr:hypothetical protein [Acidobacteriota bacterium]
MPSWRFITTVALSLFLIPVLFSLRSATAASRTTPIPSTSASVEADVPPGVADETRALAKGLLEPAASPEWTAPFGVRFQDESTNLPVMALFAMPGEAVAIEAVPGESGGPFRLSADGGTLDAAGEGRWTWSAPRAAGLYPLVLTDAAGRSIRLQAFVMVPYAGESELNGYAVGQYQAKPLHGRPVYERPQGLVEIRPELLDQPVSPHFQLGQFLCKQAGPFPKYLLLRTRLLVKLELLLDEVQAEGIDASTFTIMSGFRTPRYNAAIGNTTIYSRHSYGDAADIFIDEDGDGLMDDLDGDHRSTLADARVLGQIVDRLEASPTYEPFIGGLGLYGAKPNHGPFVHVDTRGFTARW